MSMIARGTRLCTLFLSITLLIGCGTDAPVPSQSAATVTTSYSAVVSTSVATVPAIRITDAKGRGVRNVLVRWRVTSGEGKVTNDTTRTARDGTASSGGWLLGTRAGVQTLQATTDGVPAVDFTANVAPGPVTALNPVSSDANAPVVNTPVSPTPVVRAVDVFGNPVPGVPVTFTVIQGTGSVTGEQQITNSEGLATLGAWTLGTGAGIQVLRATALGATGTTFSVVAVAGAPVDLVRLGGERFDAPGGQPVSTPPGVRVVDAFSNGVGNVAVTFEPGANSGVVTSATVLSDPANGTAFVGSWRLGSEPVQSLVATSTRLPGKRVTFTANVIASNFFLDVRFVGEPTVTVQAAFANAARRWKQLIVGRVHDVPVATSAGICGESWIPAINETVRDVVIFARTTPIDGAGSILGQAFICGTNTRNNMPVIGVMEFDEDDMPGLIANGSLGNVILHEMGHVLGIGTLWNRGRSLLNGAGTDDPFFSGSATRTEFAAMNTLTYSGTPVPVEGTGGPGTRDSHWRETTFTRELMTGFLDRNGTIPLSRVTVASLQDLGYQVNLSAADPYSITAALYAFPFVERGLSLHRDVVRGPEIGFGPKGEIIRLR
jgi:hypothetical protein